MTRGLWVLALLTVGCAGAKLDNHGVPGSGETNDMAVGDHGPKAPPDTSSGPTASGCNGVTEKGRCEISDKGQVAVVCDVAAGQLQRFDCSAMTKACVIDSSRGATCVTLPPPAMPGPPGADMAHATPADMATTTPVPHDMALPPSPRDMATTTPAPRDMATAPPMCVSGVDYRGYCASASGNGAADTAIWCDPSTGQTFVVSCAARGQTCQVDGCADGAYCCDAPTPVDMAQPPQMTGECDALGYAGQCTTDGHARWCDNGQVYDLDCGARGQSCAVDGCASGAYCCDDIPPPSTDPQCDALGIAGECDGNVARWCSGGQIVELDCDTSATTCEVDTCATGAYCCTD